MVESNRKHQSSTGHQIMVLMLGAAISGMLFSASVALPFVGFLSGFIAATPLSYVRLHSGRRAAVISAITATILVGLAFKPLVAAWYLAQCGLIGIILPDLLLNGKKPSSAILWSTAAATALSAIVVLAISSSAGQGIGSIAQKEIATGMDQAIKLYENQKGISTEDLEILRQGMKTISSVMLKIYPALATINLLVISGVTFLLFRRIAVTNGTGLIEAPFREFKTPEPFIWLLIPAGFAMLAPTPMITTPAMNVLALLSVLYFCQGLAVVITFAERTQFASVLKIVIGVLLLTQPYLIPVVTITGMFDLWGEFRSPNTKQEENL